MGAHSDLASSSFFAELLRDVATTAGQVTFEWRGTSLRFQLSLRTCLI